MIFIELNDAAVNELQKKSLRKEDRIYLLYDIEGCGCAVSGVAALLIADAFEEEGAPAQTNTELPIYYLPRQEVFFEEKLRLDYLTDRRAFRLMSDGQIYGSNLPVSDRRLAAPTPSGAAQ